MQIRHIRPGSLEWQDAKAEEVEPGTERLTPEEIIHLRTITEDRQSASEQEQRSPVRIQ